MIVTLDYPQVCLGLIYLALLHGAAPIMLWLVTFYISKAVQLSPGWFYSNQLQRYSRNTNHNRKINYLGVRAVIFNGGSETTYYGTFEFDYTSYVVLDGGNPGGFVLNNSNQRGIMSNFSNGLQIKNVLINEPTEAGIRLQGCRTSSSIKSKFQAVGSQTKVVYTLAAAQTTIVFKA